MEKSDKEIEKANKLLRDQADNVEFIKDAYRSMAEAMKEAMEDVIDSMQGVDDMGARIAKSAEREIVSSFKKLGNTLENNVTIQAKILKGQNASKDIQNQRIKIESRLAQTSAKIRNNYNLTADIQEQQVAEAEAQAGYAYDSLDALEKQNREQIKSVSLFKMTGGILANMANKLDKSGALAELLKGDFGQITAARVGEAGVISAMDLLTTGITDVSNQTTQFQKDLGLSADKALKLRGRLANIALLSGETALNTTTTVNAFETLNSLGTANVGFSDELLKQTGLLETRFGMTADQQARFGFESIKSGKAINDILKGSIAIMNATEETTGREMQKLPILQEAANITGEIRAQLGFSIENIVAATHKAKSFGMTLKDLQGVSNNLLDFQSSIANELEAELFLGKQLHLEKARLFSLTGDYEGLTREIMKNIGGEYEFLKLNTLQRRKYAAALGMSVDHMSDLIFTNETLAELEKEAIDRGDQREIDNIKALSLQQEFALAVEKIQQGIVALVDGPLGTLAKGMISLMDNAMVLYGTLGLIAGMQFMGLAASIGTLIARLVPASIAAATMKAFINPVTFLASAGLALGATALITGIVGSATGIEDGTIENGIITSEPRGTMRLTPFDKADQVVIGTNLRGGGGGGQSQQPVVNISGVTLTADKFGTRALYSDGKSNEETYS